MSSDNIPSLHSLLGHKHEAVAWLEKAVENGGLRSFRSAYFERYIDMLEHEDWDLIIEFCGRLVILSSRSGTSRICI